MELVESIEFIAHFYALRADVPQNYLYYTIYFGHTLNPPSALSVSPDAAEPARMVHSDVIKEDTIAMVTFDHFMQHSLLALNWIYLTEFLQVNIPHNTIS